MQEGDQFLPGTGESFLVDEFYSGRRGLFELVLDIVCAEGHMMNAAARVLFKELGDGTLWIRRFEQFDVNFSNAEERRADFLGRDFFAAFAFEPKRFFIIGDGLIQ